MNQKYDVGLRHSSPSYTASAHSVRANLESMLGLEVDCERQVSRTWVAGFKTCDLDSCTFSVRVSDQVEKGS